jgi:carbamoyl-phosphate synthase large subunit
MRNTNDQANVLVTSAGTIVAQGIIKSLKLLKDQNVKGQKYRIIAADMNLQTASLYRSDLGILLPEISSHKYIDSIINVCKEEHVRAIFVGADEELLQMAKAQNRIQQESGAVVITNPVETIEIGMDKWRTFELLHRAGLPCPESSPGDDPEGFVKEVGLPMMVKPREGHGSLHSYVAKNIEDVRKAIAAIEGVGWHPMLQEYISDDDSEFTTGVTVDASGKYVMSSIAMRRTLKFGQTWKAIVDDFPDVRKTAEEVALRLSARGPINVQGRFADGKLKIFEINPRFSASCPIRAAAGVNEPDIIFRNKVVGEEVRINGYRSLVCMRYWNEVYVPYSDYLEGVDKHRVEGLDSFIPDYF